MAHYVVDEVPADGHFGGSLGTSEWTLIMAYNVIMPSACSPFLSLFHVVLVHTKSRLILPETSRVSDIMRVPTPRPMRYEAKMPLAEGIAALRAAWLNLLVAILRNRYLNTFTTFSHLF